MANVPIEELDIGTMTASQKTDGNGTAPPRISEASLPEAEASIKSGNGLEIPATAAPPQPVDYSADAVQPPAMTITVDAVQQTTEMLGIIHTNFPEQLDADFRFEDIGPFPESYRTLNSKERLLLLFAENFRLQYGRRFPQRRPRILALPNECGVQKFVSTTIRPTYMLHSRLIGAWQEIASFVADFVHYEPLVDQLKMVSYFFFPPKSDKCI